MAKPCGICAKLRLRGQEGDATGSIYNCPPHGPQNEEISGEL